ncbi:MAG: tRNA 2-thiouridine(34) synthase MnmA [Deltaproteobacteria bacterium]|nr:MAG: tRNA 2-thiouridine(34) synthase MnmA [Deltaproteobacteria bacterium]
MSGGVDSSVAAALLKEQGHEVIGVHMKLHDAGPASAAPGHCCGLDDALDARRVAAELDIPFYVLDLQEAFRKAVMDDLADTYLAGATPNPCIQCNGVLKFRVLMGRALALGATHLATGHYAQIGHTDAGACLRMAVDPDKDQSYFLFPMRQSALERTLFPLGGMTKAEVRVKAEALGLVTASKPESQEICFIPDDDHARFVKEHRPEADGSGEIVDALGRVLGHHDGYFRYTIGQRRGLGVALGRPAYVTRIEPETRRVVIGFGEELEHAGLVADAGNWFDRPTPDQTVHVRLRHRGGLVPCRVRASEPGEPLTVDFLDSARAVAPGQAAVFYEGDRVLGGAWIRRSIPVAREAV